MGIFCLEIGLIIRSMESKSCCRCRVIKSKDSFAKNKRIKDGLHTHCRDCHKIEYQNTKDYQKEYAKQWVCDNKERHNKRQKQYFQENKKSLINKHLAYTKARRANDPLYALAHNMRSRLTDFFKLKGTKKQYRTEQLLGCSFKDFKDYLESKFEPWMTWENRGLYNNSTNHGWDVDHIIPLSSAKTEEELIKLCHYANLQPLCSYINRCVKKDNG